MSNPWHCSVSHTEAGLRPLDWCNGDYGCAISTDRASRCFDLTHAGLKGRRMGLAPIGEQPPHLVLTRACTMDCPHHPAPCIAWGFFVHQIWGGRLSDRTRK